jgi:hypothetical protein
MIENEHQLEQARESLRLLKETISANQESWFSREQAFEELAAVQKSIEEYEKRARATH